MRALLGLGQVVQSQKPEQLVQRERVITPTPGSQEAYMYQIERAIFDIRRGLPVVVNAGEQRLLVQALEGSESVEALARLAGARPSLVLTRHRLAAMGVTLAAEAASLPLATRISTNELHGLATAETLSQPASGLLSGLKPAGLAELGAVTLMRRALLIPAALCAFAVSYTHLTLPTICSV